MLTLLFAPQPSAVVTGALAYFRLIAKQFSAVPDDVVNQWLTIAAMFANTGCLEGDKKDFAIALYAAHLLYLDDQNTSGSGGRGYIKSEREGDLSRTYGGGYTGDDSWYGLSPYGQQYLNITAGCFGSGIMTRFGADSFGGVAAWADDVNVWDQPRNLY